MTNAPTEADTYEWLEAIDRHPDMTVAESLAALWVLGVDVDMSETDLYNAVYKLVEFGFWWRCSRLRCSLGVRSVFGCAVRLERLAAGGDRGCWKPTKKSCLLTCMVKY